MGTDRRRGTPGPRSCGGRAAPVLKLAVDARDIARDRRGIGRYVRELVRRFAAAEDLELTLLVDAPFPRLVRPRLRALLGSDRFALARRVPRDCDLIWHPWNGTFFAADCPSVATIHDAVPFAYPAHDARKAASQQGPIRRSAGEAAAIITDSAFSAAEIERRLGVPGERIVTIPLGVGPPFGPGPVGAHPGYVLVVGSDEPHKNVSTLVAGARIALDGRETMLWGLGPTLPTGGPFRPLPPVDEEALVALYRGALFLAAPALYEGFGLPLLEAMACGTPVLASRAGPYPEVCGDACAWVDPPDDPRAWAEALCELLDDPVRRSDLRERGLRRAAEFTWERTAAATLAVLRAHAQAGAAREPASAAHN